MLRTTDPPPDAFSGRTLESVRRIGKRIVLGFEEEHFSVMHLMIAGRLIWRSLSSVGPKVLDGLPSFLIRASAVVFILLLAFRL